MSARAYKLIEQANRLPKLEAERARIDQLWKYEAQYGMYTRICGIDEVGRGPLAGVVAGSGHFAEGLRHPSTSTIQALGTAKWRNCTMIMEKAVAVGIGMVGPERIDEINILQATYERCGSYKQIGRCTRYIIK